MIVRERMSIAYQRVLEHDNFKDGAAAHALEQKLETEVQMLQRENAVLQKQIFQTKRLTERLANEHQMRNVL